ncbi:MAG: WYL domain-containing protein [Betaproteobacteria bacterium]|nr:WYL domain-containing protein [Betaproteobacteria bacterium]MDE2123384.1 WYL domain-containing protein [Betaproteobacteria bacterium]MDE2188026.1 WYL domain-containing protein [Betaproteobacteria bacterium]MDE2324709.1 WYL domain-containing protein [Betaproteobacteria bacterium]
MTDRLAGLGYSVTKRTVERDLNDLAPLFGFTCNDKGMPYGWHWMEGASLNLPGLSLTEALSLRIVEESLRPLLPAAVLQALEPRLRQAQDKLAEQSATNAQARWANKVRAVSASLPLLPPQVMPGVLEAVQDALLHDLQVQVHYTRAAERDPVTYTLHPLALVQRGPVSYLVATAFDYPDIRTYAVHRMRSAEVLEQAVQVPAGFDLDAYIASGALQFGAGQTIRLKARVDVVLAQILRETPLSEDQTLGQARKSFCALTATVQDTWQLRWWLLSHANQVVVLSPAALRADLTLRIAEAVELYGV